MMGLESPNKCSHCFPGCEEPAVTFFFSETTLLTLTKLNPWSHWLLQGLSRWSMQGHMEALEVNFNQMGSWKQLEGYLIFLFSHDGLFWLCVCVCVCVCVFSYLFSGDISNGLRAFEFLKSYVHFSNITYFLFVLP